MTFMADGEITLKLDDATVARLRAAAEAAGQPVEAYAAGIVSHAVVGDYAECRRRAEDYDRTGKYLTVEEAMATFDTAVDDYFAKKK